MATRSDAERLAALAQSGITTPTRGHTAMVTVFLSPNYDASRVRTAVAQVPSLCRRTMEDIPGRGGNVSNEQENGTEVVVGVEPQLWRRWVPVDQVPIECSSFEAITSPDGTIRFPVRIGDIFLYVKGDRRDLCYVVASRFMDDIGWENVADVEEEDGWQFLEGRDLTGFIDGTRNAPALGPRVDAAVMDEFEGHPGGSYAFHATFRHDLRKFRSFTDHEKSVTMGRDYTVLVQGRLGPFNPELPSTEDEKQGAPCMQPDSHINRAFGLMFRQSYPFGTVQEAGLLFLCFSRSRLEIDQTLHRMAGDQKSDGVVDRLFGFSRAVGAAYYYCPPRTQLTHLCDA